jgi:GntR family transcriptional regulator
MTSQESPRSRSTLSEDIRRTLVDRIAAGRYVPGERLPSEVDLAQELDVSVAPIRAAFSQLVAAGVIYRRPGSGTYVSEDPIHHELATWSSFTQELRRLGIPFETTVENYAPVVTLPSRVQRHFPRLATAGPMYLERLVRFDDRTRIFTRSWFGRDGLDEVPTHEYFAQAHSLYQWFRSKGQEVAFAETKFQVTSMDEELARHFGAEWGTPVVLLEGTAYTRSGQIEYSETFYEHTSFTFTANHAIPTARES